MWSHLPEYVGDRTKEAIVAFFFRGSGAGCRSRELMLDYDIMSSVGSGGWCILYCTHGHGDLCFLLSAEAVAPGLLSSIFFVCT